MRKRIRAVLVGETPMLHNPKTRQLLVALVTGQRKPRVTDMPFEDRIKPLIIRENGDEDGKIGVPVKYLYGCLINAGKEVKLDARSRVSTATSTKLFAFLKIHGMFLAFSEHSEPQVDVQGGVNPNGGEAVTIIRPRFDQWKLPVEFTINDEVLSAITEETVKKLFHIAGQVVGLGDFSPRKRGPYGTFTVESWEVVEDSDAKKTKKAA